MNIVNINRIILWYDILTNQHLYREQSFILSTSHIVQVIIKSMCFWNFSNPLMKLIVKMWYFLLLFSLTKRSDVFSLLNRMVWLYYAKLCLVGPLRMLVLSNLPTAWDYMGVELKLGSREEFCGFSLCFFFLITYCVLCMRTIEYPGFERALFKQIKKKCFSNNFFVLWWNWEYEMAWFMCRVEQVYEINLYADTHTQKKYVPRYIIIHHNGLFPSCISIYWT